ncbi:MAG TPA: hypothetical protein VIY72_06175 [Acidimicrobiales bacterium]
MAGRLGAYCWTEQLLFGLLGGWVPEVPEIDVKLALAEHADHAAWRAQRWYELLPTAAPGPDALVAAPDGLEDLKARIAAVADGPDRTVEKLTVTYRILLPRLAAALDAHRSWAATVSGPAVLRLLGVAASDLATDWVAGERLLQTLVSGLPELERCHVAQAVLEAPVAAAGGLVGALSAGDRPLGGGA